jgi:hypothetical protein
MDEQSLTGAAASSGAAADSSGTSATGSGAEADSSGTPGAGSGPAADSSSSPPTAGSGAAGSGTEPASRTADVTAGPGGVMTDEVGVVTGDLTLRTEFDGGQVTLRVQYREAEEWYTVTGGRAPLPAGAGLDAVHTIAVGLLHRPEG